jgi:hypothetical protein
MHETNGELMERNDKYKLSNNMFNDALVVVSNLIARATTKWTLEETKLFFIDNGHNLFLDPVQKFRLIHLHQEGLKTPVQCLDAIY